MSFLNSFTDNVHKYPNKVALDFIDPPAQKITYAEIDELVNGTARYLKGVGIEAGDRVALQLSKCLEFILLHLATIRLGGISLPLNLAYPPDELRYFLQDSGAKLFFTLESSKDRIESVVAELPDLQGCICINPDQPDKFRSLVTNYQRTGGFDTSLGDDSGLLHHRV